MASKKDAPDMDATGATGAAQQGQPEPITAPDGKGGHRPMSGGSFTRQADGTLVRNKES